MKSKQQLILERYLNEHWFVDYHSKYEPTGMTKREWKDYIRMLMRGLISDIRALPGYKRTKLVPDDQMLPDNSHSNHTI